jgi:lipoyl(octanoyl) transferase
MMIVAHPELPSPPAPDLRVYLLGEIEFDAALRLQHDLLRRIADERTWGALILCEHPPLITIGRQGSPGDIRATREELQARRWQVRWVNRGGGSWLHLPGQLAVYSILPLDQFDMGLEAYVERLQRVLIAVLDDFGVHAEMRPGEAEVRVKDRPIAGVGVAVRDWVSYFGAVLNIGPDLSAFRLVHTGGSEVGPMTSLARERRAPLRPALVRQRLLDHFSAIFPVERGDLYFTHPALTRARCAH